MPLKLAVIVHDEARLLLVEPVRLVVFEGHLCLGIELLIVGRGAHVDGTCQFHADETAATGGVGEYVRHVCRGNEGCKPWEVLHVASVGSLDFHGGQLDDVLQETFLHLARNGIELVEVDEQELAHLLKHLAFFREVYVFVEAPLQFAG